MSQNLEIFLDELPRNLSWAKAKSSFLSSQLTQVTLIAKMCLGIAFIQHALSDWKMIRIAKI